MTLEELKIRQLTNQYLLAPADKLTVMRDLCGVQAQFMTNALHSLKIRTTPTRVHQRLSQNNLRKRQISCETTAELSK